MYSRTILPIAMLAALTLGVAQQSQKAELKLASEVAAELAKQTGVKVYLESRAGKEKVAWTPPAATLTAETMQSEVERLVKALPKGADWGVLYLPPPPEGKFWKGDDVLAYARAQAQLYGKVGATETGSVEILSQRLPPDKSKDVIAALNLKPVYIIALGRGSFAGVWQTTFGEMRLRTNGSRITGTYTSGGGEISGTVNGSTMTFRWFEVERDQGGTGVFRLSEDGDSFTGEWWNDGDNDGGASSWAGTRISR